MIKVLIVDDHQLVRTGLVGLLEQEPGIQVVGESASGEEAVRAVDELNPPSDFDGSSNARHRRP